MDVSDIARTVLAIEVALHYPTSSFIMAGNAFTKFGDEGIKSQDFRIAIDGIDQVN